MSVKHRKHLRISIALAGVSAALLLGIRVWTGPAFQQGMKTGLCGSPLARGLASVGQCEALYTRLLEFKKSEGNAASVAPVKRYPRGINPSLNPEKHLRFGFESEYVLDESGKLLSLYGPDERFGISKEAWLAKTAEERVQWVKDHVNELFPELRTDGGLVKIADGQDFEKFPERLIRDSTGNLELIFKPADTLAEWDFFVTKLDEVAGPGSMQGSIGAPPESFFSTSLDANKGYFNFMNDSDTLGKLVDGYERYLEKPESAVARSFTHPYLGPMTALKREKLEQYLEQNARGLMGTPEDLQKVAGEDSSFKYIGGTAYRPDIAWPHAVVQEVRDCHKNIQCLREHVLRTAYYAEYGNEQFANAAKLKAFDSVRDFEKLPQSVQQTLEKVFPAPPSPANIYSEEERLARSVYRNFAYPMRDWSGHLELLKKPELKLSVTTAQNSYQERLTEIAAKLEAGEMDKKAASLEIQGALAKFSKDSGLKEAMDQWQLKNLAESKDGKHYMNLASREFQPLKDAFGPEIWEGSLNSRVKRLMDRWPQNIRFVEDVPFSYSGASAKTTNRKVMVISNQGLDFQQAESLRKDYINAMARGTVSFPLGSRAGHLYSRIGTKTVDYYSGFNLNDYPLSTGYGTGGQRLEPVIQLSPLEEMRLRSYAQNGNLDRLGVLGSNSYAGVADAQTVGRRKDNRPKRPGVGHNCTSWMCTGPIGYNREPLMSLVGLPVADESHTNPGWWSHFLTGAGKEDRIPFVVYWTGSSMEDALQSEVKPGQPITWNFDLH